MIVTHIRRVILLLASWCLAVSAPLVAQRYGTPGVIPPVPPAYCQPKDDRIAVLLNGTYHMANPGAERFNLAADDVLAPKRQGEIVALVRRFAEFRPTKVAVEARGDSIWQRRYQEYLAGAHADSHNEREQVGFRLAQAMGHARIYAIDARMGLSDERLEPLVAKHERFQALFGEMQQWGEWAIATMAEWLAEGTIGQLLYRVNTPEAIAIAHAGYLDYFAPIGEDANFAGADFVATWYQRNLRIFSRLTRIAERDDRIFIVIGAGHVPILRQLLIDASGYCVEDPLPYLEPPA